MPCFMSEGGWGGMSPQDVADIMKITWEELVETAMLLINEQTKLPITEQEMI